MIESDESYESCSACGSYKVEETEEEDTNNLILLCGDCGYSEIKE